MITSRLIDADELKSKFLEMGCMDNEPCYGAEIIDRMPTFRAIPNVVNVIYDRGYDAGRKAVLDEILLKITHLRSKVYLNAQDQILVEVLTIINNEIRELSV